MKNENEKQYNQEEITSNHKEDLFLASNAIHSISKLQSEEELGKNDYQTPHIKGSPQAEFDSKELSGVHKVSFIAKLFKKRKMYKTATTVEVIQRFIFVYILALFVPLNTIGLALMGVFNLFKTHVILASSIQLILDILSIFIAYKIGKRYKVFDKLSFKNIKPKDTFIIVLLWALAITLNIIYSLVYVHITGHPFKNTQNEAYLEKALKHIPFVIMFISVAIVPPIVEEILYRGMLIKYVFMNKFRFLAIPVTFVLFAYVHSPSDIMSWLIYLTLSGTILAVYLRRGRLEHSMLYHFINNSVSALPLVAHLAGFF